MFDKRKWESRLPDRPPLTERVDPRQIQLLHACSLCGSNEVKLILEGSQQFRGIDEPMRPEYEVRWVICRNCGKERHRGEIVHEHEYTPDVMDLLPTVSGELDDWHKLVARARKLTAEDV